MNASALLAFNQAVQQTNEALFPATIQFGPAELVSQAQPIAASTGGVRRSNTLAEDGGLREILEAVFRVRKELISGEPPAGWRVYWVERQLTFRLVRPVDTGTVDPSYTFHCEALA